MSRSSADGFLDKVSAARITSIGRGRRADDVAVYLSEIACASIVPPPGFKVVFDDGDRASKLAMGIVILGDPGDGKSHLVSGTLANLQTVTFPNTLKGPNKTDPVNSYARNLSTLGPLAREHEHLLHVLDEHANGVHTTAFQFFLRTM